MTKSSKKTRPWTIDDLYNRKAHIRAVPILVLEKWERESGVPGADRLTTDEIHGELVARGLLEKPMTRQGAGNLVGSFRQKEKRHNLKPTLVEPVDQGIWRFNVRYYEDLLRQFRERYPIMSEDVPAPPPPLQQQVSVKKEDTGVQPRSAADKILQAVQEYERDWQQRLRDAENRATALEQKNRELHEKLSESSSILNDITDDVLKKRVEPLLELDSLPLDMIVREASVVFEDRLRTVGGLDSGQYGEGLVKAVLQKDKGTLLFSANPTEQDGVMMLYLGAMKFIRNPPMHKLIEYPRSTARLLIRLIDSLLQLLSEAEPRQME